MKDKEFESIFTVLTKRYYAPLTINQLDMEYPEIIEQLLEENFTDAQTKTLKEVLTPIVLRSTGLKKIINALMKANLLTDTLLSVEDPRYLKNVETVGLKLSPGLAYIHDILPHLPPPQLSRDFVNIPKKEEEVGLLWIERSEKKDPTLFQDAVIAHHTVREVVTEGTVFRGLAVKKFSDFDYKFREPTFVSPLLEHAIGFMLGATDMVGANFGLMLRIDLPKNFVLAVDQPREWLLPSDTRLVRNNNIPVYFIQQYGKYPVGIISVTAIQTPRSAFSK